MWTVTGLVMAYSHIKLYLVNIADLNINESIKALERRKLCRKISKKRKEKGSKPNAIY